MAETPLVFWEICHAQSFCYGCDLDLRMVPA